ncbi:MAG: TatD family hydrolase [Oscillospiraceae bacterium]
MYSGIFDSHAHYDSEQFDEDRDAVIKNINDNGVVGVINVGCDIKSSEFSVSIAKKHGFFYCAVGIHPNEVEDIDGDYLEKIAVLASQQKVVAIGEIGLDYHYDSTLRDVQKRVFEHQLQLANELNMPVIIHSREATLDTQVLLKKYKPRGVVHCFSSSKEIAKEDIDAGLYIGFTGVCTFNNAKTILEVIKITPLERILLETDCPYMAPVPFRGQRTTSDMIAKTAETIAKIKGIDTQKLIDLATINTRTLFNINQ